jgi:hypothetical protein
MTQTRFAEVAAHHLLQLRERQPREVSRQLLGPDLQQKGRHEEQATTAAHCIEGRSRHRVQDTQRPEPLSSAALCLLQPAFRYGRDNTLISVSP